MGWTSVILGLIVAIGLVAGAVKAPSASMRSASLLAAGLVLFAGIAFSSIRFVPSDRVGIVVKNALGPSMAPGQVIAKDGEQGVQAQVLAPGWKFWYWPVVYEVNNVPLVQVPSGSVGVVEAIDGNPLSLGQVFADEMDPARFQTLLQDPLSFLEEGQKGPQTTVLTPGQYRLNTDLFKVEMVNQTDVKPGTVAVLKSNVGEAATLQLATPGDQGDTVYLAQEGEKGIRAVALLPGKYPLNPAAFEVNTVSTERRVADYTESNRFSDANAGVVNRESSINVKSQDGFNFPVDVRVVYFIKREDAPKVVALLGGDNQNLQNLLTSRVRAIFRDNAESVSALDYINQRTTQAANANRMLQAAMSPYGVTIEAIDIGDVGGDDPELAKLLETQRQRKIATEEEQTLIVQQAAAEQQKELERIKQEAEEERRLATAKYQVLIAEEAQQQKIIEAQADAEAIRIRAEAEAAAYQQIALQIGPSNVAMIELLKIVGEQGINITPRVMFTGGASGGDSNAETAALIGTLLDRMVDSDGADRAQRNQNALPAANNND